MLQRLLLACLLLGLLPPSSVLAQEDETSIFGSLQTIFLNQKSRFTSNYGTGTGSFDVSEERSSFAVQQLDLFLHKAIGESFSAFVNLEYQLNYSSANRWGSLSIQEAWINYSPMDEFNVKAGMLYPAFNNLNEIKNRLALLPYILRPGVYERLLSDVYMSEDYLPEHAFLQLHGAIPHGDIFWDYAVFTGNAESSDISRRDANGNPVNDLNSNFEFLSGVDPTEFNMKLFGGRIGIRARSENFKFGISMTHDYDNLRDTLLFPHIYTGVRGPLQGDARRYRIGSDLSGDVGPVHFESEIIRVVYDYDAADKLDVDLDRLFYYSMLGYHVDERLFVFGYYEGGENTFGVSARHRTAAGGVAYRINSSVTAKAQYIVFKENVESDRADDELLLRFVFLGFSIVL